MQQFKKPIYLDFHSTTPVEPSVLDAMLPCFTTNFGNPASRSHPYGWQASEAVEQARQQVADLLNVRKEEIFFTSGSTEGLNMAIKGLAEFLSHKGKHIITVSTEHHAVLDSLASLEKKGFEVSRLSVTARGQLEPDSLIQNFRSDSIMVVAMMANNETGTIHDVNAIGEICAAKGIVFISDTTQAAGKIPVNPVACHMDVAVLSAHKMYGPKGAGAIYIAKNDKKLKPDALIHGGGHEMGYRSGTLNVPGIVGLGAAAKLFMSDAQHVSSAIADLRNEFESTILDNLEQVQVNGDVDKRLYSVSNLRVMHVDSQAVMTKLRTKVSFSSGSACSSADPSPSHVLLAMGLSTAEAKGSFRFSFGRQTTLEEVKTAATLFMDAVNEYRSESPVWQMFTKGLDVTSSGI